MTSLQAGLLVALGAVVFLDRWPAVQTLVSRPIVVGPLTGAVLGAPLEGVLWGAAFEAAYLDALPVGAARYANAGLAALVATAVAIGHRSEAVYPAGYAALAGLAAGRLGEFVDGVQRSWNGRAAARARARVETGDLSAPGRTIAAALARGAGLGAGQTAVALAVAWIGAGLVGDTPWGGPLPAEGLRAAAFATLAVGGIRLFVDGRRAAALAGVGAALAAGAWWIAA